MSPIRRKTVNILDRPLTLSVNPIGKNEDSQQDIVNQIELARLNGLIVIRLGLGLQIIFVKYGRNHHNVYSVSFS